MTHDRVLKWTDEVDREIVKREEEAFEELLKEEELRGQIYENEDLN
jgi:hypothetical protein